MQFNTNTKSIGRQILLSLLMLVMITAFLLLFVLYNNRNIIAQNEGYIADATKLSASRFEDRMKASMDSLAMMTALYGNIMDSPDVDVEQLVELSGGSRFDHLEFIPADGQIVTSSGTHADVTDRDAYRKGMQGETGVCAVINNELAQHQFFSFYTPLRYQGEIIGVLCGLYSEERMQDIIETQFFGVTARTYLCMGDGTVITCAGTKKKPDNLLEFVINSQNITGKSEDAFRHAFETHTSQSFSYENSTGTANAYLAVLEYNDWVLVQVFPASITNQMRSTTDNAAVALVGGVIAAFLIYIGYLLISKQRKERQLRDENEEISQIVMSVTELFSRFAIADLKHNTYSYVTKADGMPESGTYTTLLEYVSEFYVDGEDGVDMKAMITPEHIREVMTKDVSYLQYEYHICRGEDRWENMSVICLKRDSSGKPISVLFAIQNITERKRMELESHVALQNAFDAAKAADRAKSDFLSRMSHDIRTPMNAVMGMTTVATMHIDDKERVRECLGKITSSSRHLLALINDILDMSKIESGKLTLSEEPFNLAEMTESLLTIMSPQIKAKNQQISMSTSHLVHEDVVGDTLRLRQVFVNIMGNAVKFTPEGGSISLEIRELSSHIPDKAQYEFVFRDTGIGMEKSYLEHIFEPFSRAENDDTRKAEGTGLGMPIARNIVNMMNGSISVDSEPGKGSVFTVRVYLTIQNLQDTDAGCLADLRILVADDDKDAAESTRDILQGLGMHATSVYGGREAVEEVIARHGREDAFDAVILDWQMPGTNGIEAADKIRKTVGDTVPIIILSAYDWTEIEQQARETGVNAFIGKPLFRSRLIYVLRSLVQPEQTPSQSSEIQSFTENHYQGKRILLVEDNELNREIACELLTTIGVEVEMAFDGQYAVEMATGKPAGYYDLIFMDIQMPRMNGYEATKAIRSAGREDLRKIPIVAMSADAFSDDVFRAMKSGMNDHISKPVEISKLSETLSKWLNASTQ